MWLWKLQLQNHILINQNVSKDMIIKALDAFTIKILTSKTTYKFRKHLQTYHLTLTNLNLEISKNLPKWLKQSFSKIKKINNYRLLH